MAIRIAAILRRNCAIFIGLLNCILTRLRYPDDRTGCDYFNGPGMGKFAIFIINKGKMLSWQPVIDHIVVRILAIPL